MSAAFETSLAAYHQVCLQLAVLSEEEGRALESGVKPPIVEITRRRRDLLRELARTQSAVKAASPVPFPDRLRPALQATLDLIQRSVRLDRQNEQWMLRHQMIPGDLVPSSASRSPQRIRSTYGLRAGGIGP